MALEQPAPLCRPAGQSAQALTRYPHELEVVDRPVSYCPTPHPVAPWNRQLLVEQVPLERQQASDRPSGSTQALASVAWPARPELVIPLAAHGPWRLPSPGHQ